MDNISTKDLVDHQRWLINNGLANDMLKDNLYLFGIYLHPGIQDALVSIDFNDKVITYQIYVNKYLLNDFNKYKKLLASTGKLNTIRLKRLWRKHFENKKDPARLDIDTIINSHVKSLCGPNWSTSVKILPYSQYISDVASFDNGNQKDSDINRESNG